MISLRGKVALITGGSRGIGLAIAKNFAAKGASTILVARNPEGLRTAVAALESVNYIHTPAPEEDQEQKREGNELDEAYPPCYAGVAGDVSKASMWSGLVSKLGEGHMLQRRSGPRGVFHKDRVDVLVNCAGIAQNSLLVKMHPDTIAEILDTNLRSALLGCRAITRHVLSDRLPTNVSSNHTRLSIINVSSVMATRGGRGAVAYAASKAGLLGLTSSLAVEMASKGIRVNALVPGYIKTDMTTGLDSQPSLLKHIPLNRLGTSEEVADAAAFLAQNSYANGCILNIDGGLSASGCHPHG